VSTVTINWLDDEVVSIEVDGIEIISVTHDQHGWDGMHAAIDTATNLAEALGVEVRTEGTPNL
jgi:hypothetical protein